MSVQPTTVVFPFQKGEILLGRHKRGPGKGKWNGYGGKLEVNETYSENAVRETMEEAVIHIKELRIVARQVFCFDGVPTFANVSFFAGSFEDQPQETTEMATPTLFRPDALPYDEMWEADRLWLPVALEAEPDAPPQKLMVYFTKDKRLDHMRSATAEEIALYFPGSHGLDGILTDQKAV